jgi:carbamoyl-phosphate synthase small subunit
MLGKLILEDGSEYNGTVFGAAHSSAGETVFSTAVTGYTESLSDPSYSGQILTLTFPLVGNYGIPGKARDENIAKYFESDKVQAAGLIVNNYSPEYSHWNAEKSLSDWLEEYGVPGLTGIDTRALTQKLREKGSLLGKIVIHEDIPFFDPDKHDLLQKVTIEKIDELGNGKYKIMLVDCGSKTNIIRCLMSRDATVIRVPWNHDFSTEEYDGLFISNGPGNPKRAGLIIDNLKKAFQKEKPIMGICLGHQLMSLASGADTLKMKYGHRSHNQPVLLYNTDRAFITSQNHGYVVDNPTIPAEWEHYFVNLNDGTNEGIYHKSLPYFSVQFHPEASSGPTDTEFLFDEFMNMVKRGSK